MKVNAKPKPKSNKTEKKTVSRRDFNGFGRTQRNECKRNWPNVGTHKNCGSSDLIGTKTCVYISLNKLMEEKNKRIKAKKAFEVAALWNVDLNMYWTDIFILIELKHRYKERHKAQFFVLCTRYCIERHDLAAPLLFAQPISITMCVCYMHAQTHMETHKLKHAHIFGVCCYFTYLIQHSAKSSAIVMWTPYTIAYKERSKR